MKKLTMEENKAIVAAAIAAGEKVYPYTCGASMSRAQWAAREIDMAAAAAEESAYYAVSECDE